MSQGPVLQYHTHGNQGQRQGRGYGQGGEGLEDRDKASGDGRKQYQQRGGEAEKTGETERIRESSETKEATGQEDREGEEDGESGLSVCCCASDLSQPSKQDWRPILVMKGQWRQAGVITMTTSFCHLC